MPIGSLEPFYLPSKQWSASKWSAYIRRLKQYILVNKVEDALRVPLLISAVGDATYAVICDLCSPIHPEDVRFDALVRLLGEHLEKTAQHHTVIAERHIFRQRRQRRGEPLVEYLESLQQLAMTCDFGASLEGNLRDQFVSGMADRAMRSRMFAETNIQYAEAVALALTLERSENNR